MRKYLLLAAASGSLAFAAPAQASAPDIRDAVASVRAPSSGLAAAARSRTMSFAQARAFTREALRLAYLDLDDAFGFGLRVRPCRRLSRTSLACWGYLDIHAGEPVVDEYGIPETYADGEPVYDQDQTCWFHLRWRFVGSGLRGALYRSHTTCEPWHD